MQGDVGMRFTKKAVGLAFSHMIVAALVLGLISPLLGQETTTKSAAQPAAQPAEKFEQWIYVP